MALPLAMFIVFVSAKLLAETFERLGQPGIVGEILAGALIGPSILGWITPNEFLNALSDLGAIFLLFRVGLEVKSSELLKMGGTATMVATSGVVIPFVLGWGILILWGKTWPESLFVGAAMVATSVGITAQVLSSMRLLHTRASKIILGAAVIDDVLGLLVLAVVSGAARGQLRLAEIAVTAVVACGFTIIIAKWGSRAMDHVAPLVSENLRLGESQFALAMSLLFGLSAGAVYAGVAAIVGAFLAGMALAETAQPRVRDMSHGVTELLLPFFLAGIGMRVDLRVFTDPRTVTLAAVILLAALASKFVGCGLGGYSLGRADALRVGVGMIPRGEVGMVVAQIGLGFGIVEQSVYSVVVLMSVATTLVAPPLIGLAFRDLLPEAEAMEEEFRLE
jgi:Kef-type K+ transport system membrane component KefB